jgi:5'-deoxynucleotidase
VNNVAKFTLQDKLRTGHVKRWQIVRVAREQTLAEHLYLVQVITEEIGRVIGMSATDISTARRWALMHDVPEVITGDLASPIKAAMKKAVPETDPVHDIELQLDDDYRDLLLSIKNNNPICKDIVKLADLMESIHFLTIEGMGSHALKVEERLRSECLDKIKSLGQVYPKYVWHGVIRVFNDICWRE